LGALVDLSCISLPFFGVGMFIIARRPPDAPPPDEEPHPARMGRGWGVFFILLAMFGLILATGRLPLGHTGTLVVLGLRGAIILAMGLLAIVYWGRRAR
jgi:hypothetical protein